MAVAGGEIINRPFFDRPDGEVWGCFGCTATPVGVVPWQRTTVYGNQGWVTIESAQNITGSRTDGRWQVDSLPGAFKVVHHCDRQHTCYD